MSSTLHDPIMTVSSHTPKTPAPAKSRWPRVLFLLLAALAVLGVIVATVFDATPADAPTDASAVAASLTDFAIDLVVDTLESGSTVTFDVVNDGQLPHDLAIQDGPATPVLATGETASITYEPSGPGQVYLVCTVPGHEAAGMHLTLPVTAN